LISNGVILGFVFQVVVRARPINGKEAAKQDFSRCLRQEGAHAISWLGQPETRFTFDHVAGENISQVSRSSQL